MPRLRRVPSAMRKLENSPSLEKRCPLAAMMLKFRTNGAGALCMGSIYRFHPYRVDVGAGEIWKHGLRLKLAPQQFQILVALLERANSLVTRDELKAKLWPSESLAASEPGLNKAVNKLRQILSDTAERPRYIETLPRRGYRFIASLEAGAAGLEAALPEAQPSSPPLDGVTRKSGSSSVTGSNLPEAAWPGSQDTLAIKKREDRPDDQIRATKAVQPARRGIAGEAQAHSDQIAGVGTLSSPPARRFWLLSLLTLIIVLIATIALLFKNKL